MSQEFNSDAAENDPPLDDTAVDGPMGQLLKEYFPDEDFQPDAEGDPGETPPNTGDDTSPTPNSGEQDAPDEGSEPSLQDELANLANVYDVPADQLEGFTSAEDAENALRMIVEQRAQRGQDFRQQPPQFQQPQYPNAQNAADAPFQQPSYQQPPPSPQQPQQQPPFQQQPPQQPLAPPKIDLSELDEDNPLAQGFKAMSDYTQQVHQQLTQMQQQQQWQQQQAAERELQMVVQTVNSKLDQLSPERYGKAGDANMFQQNARMRVGHYAETLALGYQSQGERVPSVEQLLEMADRQLFHKEIEKEQRRKAATAQQSRNGARLGKPSASARTPGSQVNSDTPLEENPELIRLWHEMQQQPA